LFVDWVKIEVGATIAIESKLRGLEKNVFFQGAKITILKDKSVIKPFDYSYDHLNNGSIA